MNAKRLPGFVAILLVTAFSITACGGGGAKVEATTSTTTTTMGQELMDLDKAYRDGIISKDQYEKSKKKILKRYDD
ncbi:MAG: SHOCT domain-containing protein [Halieaceae bacterium]|nr:SHOCT domain-containing protein [Halieaceae bacterium]